MKRVLEDGFQRKEASLADDASSPSPCQTAEQTARSDAETLRQQFAKVQLRAATAEARAAEIEKRAADLNAELGRVNQQNTDLVTALAAAARPGPPACT